MKKIALVVSNNLWICPYVKIYSKLLDEWGIDYDIISWDREGRKESGIQYESRETSRSRFAVFFSYLKFAKFVVKTIKKNGYDRLIIFTPQVGIFLSLFLKRHYRRKYIFDYRDLSIEQNAIFRKPFSNVLTNSYVNVISSPGFKKYLPKEFAYIVSHNFNVEAIKSCIGVNSEAIPNELISVLTIGAIREDSNYDVIDSLGDKEGVKVDFVGKGLAAPALERYVANKSLHNIKFTGFYNKEDEAEIIKNHSCINIIYPLIPSHISALSNRFYNSLIYKRPMIVTKGTIQGDYAEKYGVGLVISDCTDLAAILRNYIDSLDFEEYQKNCDRLLKILLEENQQFEKKVREFVL